MPVAPESSTALGPSICQAPRRTGSTCCPSCHARCAPSLPPPSSLPQLGPTPLRHPCTQGASHGSLQLHFPGLNLTLSSSRVCLSLQHLWETPPMSAPPACRVTARLQHPLSQVTCTASTTPRLQEQDYSCANRLEIPRGWRIEDGYYTEEQNSHVSWCQWHLSAQLSCYRGQWMHR